MGGEICGSAHGAVDDVVEDENSCGLGNGLRRDWVERPALYGEKAEDGSVEAEDGA